MDRVINDFVHLLRQHAVRVSPAESVEALQALHYVGLDEREVVRDALRAILVKSRDDVEVYDRLFDLYFSFQEAADTPKPQLREVDHDHGGAPSRLELGEDLEAESDEDHEHTHEPPQSIELRKFFDERQLRQGEDLHGDPDTLRLSLFAQQLVLNRKQGALQQIFDRISHQLQVRRARNVFQPGGVAPLRDSEELPIDISAAELQELIDHLHEMDVDEDLIEQLKAQADNIIEGLPELLKSMQERQKKLAAKQPDPIDLHQRSLRRLLDFSATE